MKKFAVTTGEHRQSVVTAEGYDIDERGVLHFHPRGAGTFRDWHWVLPLTEPKAEWAPEGSSNTVVVGRGASPNV